MWKTWRAVKWLDWAPPERDPQFKTGAGQHGGKDCLSVLRASPGHPGGWQKQEPKSCLLPALSGTYSLLKYACASLFDFNPCSLIAKLLHSKGSLFHLWPVDISPANLLHKAGLCPTLKGPTAQLEQSRSQSPLFVQAFILDSQWTVIQTLLLQ